MPLCISAAHMMIPATHTRMSNSISHHLVSPNVHLLCHNSRPRKPLQLCSLRSTNGDAVDIKHDPRMNGFNEIELKVRVYELDRYEVVNHAIYAYYCQVAADEFLQKHGLDGDVDPKYGNIVAFPDISFKFLGLLRCGDRFVVRTRTNCVTACLHFEHFIFKLPNEEPILEARGRAVWLDKNYRPIRIPGHVRAKLFPYVAMGTQY